MPYTPTTGDRLLAAWLSLTSTLWNKRLVSTLTYNEAHVLGILLRAEDTARVCTATTLIAQTRLLKSQMNKLLTTLEGKGFIRRARSEEDKRVVLISRLSGGNVQKVLLGREIESEPQLLITAYPVRGLDINSSYTIYDLLNEQKKKGVAVLFIGEDLDVLLELCDRIMVLCHGAVTGILEAQSATKEQIGLLMAGETIKKEADAQ